MAGWQRDDITRNKREAFIIFKEVHNILVIGVGNVQSCKLVPRDEARCYFESTYGRCNYIHRLQDILCPHGQKQPAIVGDVGDKGQRRADVHTR